MMTSDTTQPVYALVTGGVNGIGRAIVQALLTRVGKNGGAIFIFDCVRAEDSLVTALEKLGVIYIQVDLRSVDEIADGVKKLQAILEANYAGANLSLLVNNAGITRDALALRVKELDWNAVLEVNLKAAFFCIQKVLPLLMKNGKGYIINMSSVVALKANPGQVSYAASKAGLIAMTRTIAAEYASRSIYCNAIAPGCIKTRMTEELPLQVQESILSHVPLKRFGLPEEIADLVLFLSSGKADYITGQTITIDGGLSL